MTERKRISKSYPHACPVCKGRGELTEELAQHEGVVKYDLADHKIYSCHVCQGQCVIWEYRDEEAPEEIPNLLGGLQPSILSPVPNMQPFTQPYYQPMQITGIEDIKKLIDPNQITVGDPPWTVSTSWGVNNIPKFNVDGGGMKYEQE